MGRKACYESLSTGWVRCPEDHYKQHPGLQNPRGTMEQTQEIKRQRWGSTDVFGGKIGHRDDKSQREEQGSWRGGWGCRMHSVGCYGGSLIVVVILGLLLLIADMEMEVYYEKKWDRWWTGLSENYSGWGHLYSRTLIFYTLWPSSPTVPTPFSPRGLIIISGEGLILADTHMSAVWRHYCTHTPPVWMIRNLS